MITEHIYLYLISLHPRYILMIIENVVGRGFSCLACKNVLTAIAGLLVALSALSHCRQCKDHKIDKTGWDCKTLNESLRSNVPKVHRYINGLNQSSKGKRKFFKSLLPHYSNLDVTFQLLENTEYLILIAGDVNPIPGPVQRPCSVCHRAVA